MAFAAFAARPVSVIMAGLGKPLQKRISHLQPREEEVKNYDVAR
jgi:hypothetical protein